MQQIFRGWNPRFKFEVSIYQLDSFVGALLCPTDIHLVVKSCSGFNLWISAGHYLYGFRASETYARPVWLMTALTSWAAARADKSFTSDTSTKNINDSQFNHYSKTTGCSLFIQYCVFSLWWLFFLLDMLVMDLPSSDPVKKDWNTKGNAA